MRGGRGRESEVRENMGKKEREGEKLDKRGGKEMMRILGGTAANIIL